MIFKDWDGEHEVQGRRLTEIRSAPRPPALSPLSHAGCGKPQRVVHRDIVKIGTYSAAR